MIVEIRGGEGGEEGNLWAADLYEMYQRYADLHRWKVETLDQPAVGHGRHARGHVRGEGRRRLGAPQARGRTPPRAAVPATESQGRVHTSAATVTVLPEAEEIDVPSIPTTSRSTSTGRVAPAGSR